MPSTTVDRFARSVRLDRSPQHRQPPLRAVAVAAIVSIVASLIADSVLVMIGEAIFPSTKGYSHFQFANFASLTIIGILFAAASWPVVTRLTSEPRWVFSRLAVVVTAVLLLPDIAILVAGQPVRAVVVLVAMHLAIALITYHVIVRIAAVAHSRRR